MTVDLASHIVSFELIAEPKPQRKDISPVIYQIGRDLMDIVCFCLLCFKDQAIPGYLAGKCQVSALAKLENDGAFCIETRW